MARFLRSAILLAAALLPLAAQAGAVLDLLDAGRAVHPPSVVEVIVHGHAHGKRVAAHAHVAAGDLDRGPSLHAPAALRVPESDGGVAAARAPQGAPAAEAARASSPPLRLLLASLLR